MKSFIDTVVWRLGDGLSGLVILLLATGMGWSVSRISWISLVLLAGWLAAAWVAQRQYVTNLGKTINEHRRHLQRANVTVLDKAATEMLTAQMGSDDPKRILYALDLFTAGHSGASHPVVRGLLKHEAAEVRAQAVKVLNEGGDLSVRSDIERLLYDADLSVRTEALLYIAHHAHIDPLERVEQLGNFPDFSIRSAMVSFLAQPGETQNLEVAQLMLSTMVRDEDPRTSWRPHGCWNGCPMRSMRSWRSCSERGSRGAAARDPRRRTPAQTRVHRNADPSPRRSARQRGCHRGARASTKAGWLARCATTSLM